MWAWAGQYGDHAFCTMTEKTHFLHIEQELCGKCHAASRRVRWGRVLEWIHGLPEYEGLEKPND